MSIHLQMCLANTQTTPVTPKKSVDKCNQVELLVRMPNINMLQRGFVWPTFELNSDFGLLQMCPVETQTSLETSGSNKTPILSNDYTDQSCRKPLLRGSSRKKPSDLILDKILSMQRQNEETVLPTVEVRLKLQKSFIQTISLLYFNPIFFQTCHAETQTQFILNGTSPKGVDKCSQAEVEV